MLGLSTFPLIFIIMTDLSKFTISLSFYIYIYIYISKDSVSGRYIAQWLSANEMNTMITLFAINLKRHLFRNNKMSF